MHLEVFGSPYGQSAGRALAVPPTRLSLLVAALAVTKGFETPVSLWVWGDNVSRYAAQLPGPKHATTGSSMSAFNSSLLATLHAALTLDRLAKHAVFLSAYRTKDIQRLSQVLRAKQQQLSRLEEDHYQLSHRHYLLSAVCDVLQLLANLKKSANPSAVDAQQPASTIEAELLQQLRDVQQQHSTLLNYPSLGSNSSVDITASLQHLGSLPSSASPYSSNSSIGSFVNLQSLEETDTLGTFEDPLRTLRTSLLHEDQNPYPGVQDLTLEHMQAEYQTLIHQLALNVGFLDNPVIRSRDNDQNP